MKFGSVCSGIEAASVAWEPLGWQAAWFSEIEAFPSAVLAHHWPTVDNLGDMLQLPDLVDMQVIDAPDVLVGGTPCQAFSVAGRRGSLEDERGALSLAFIELANRIDEARHELDQPPAIVVWENVPGVLSTKDNAFGCFLAGLAGETEPLQPSGKRWTNAGCVFGPQRTVAWRVLDAQYFGVAQRRRRVFVVASARAGFDPTTVLFEREGVRRDTPPSREAREEITHATAPCLTGSGRGVERCGDTRGQDPVVAVPILEPGARTGKSTTDQRAGLGIGADGDPMFTLQAGKQHGVASTYQEVSHCLNVGVMPAVTVALRGREGGATAELGGEVATALRASSGGGDKPHVLAFQERGRAGGRELEIGGNVAYALTAPNGGGRAQERNILDGPNLAVRRLTPVECERLQGFPDGHTDVPYRGKPAADGPRYKAIGNSMAVPVMRWIGERIRQEAARHV